jgi:hypothetical protein
MFAHLSWQARQKKQGADADRFLILAGEQACLGGFLDLAEICRQTILQYSPHHQLGKSASFVEAMRNPDFMTLLKTIQRFCSAEKAEMLLEQADIDWPESVKKYRNFTACVMHLIQQ